MIQQYSLRKIASIWAAATLPMALLSWVVAPALAADPEAPGMERLAVLTVGLVWQFLLVVFLLRREGNGLGWSAIRHGLWLSRPRSPATGSPRTRLWFLVLPLLALTTAYQFTGAAVVHDLWIRLFPFLAEPPGYILGSGVIGAVFFAYPSKRYRCAWFGIIAHSGQSVFFFVLILGLVLGLA